MNIAEHLVVVQLSPTTLVVDIERVCTFAAENSLNGVCVPPLFVTHAKKLLTGKNVKVCTVIGFPLGYHSIEAKLAEILLALVDQADSIEVVANYMAIKNRDWAYVANEINHIIPVIKKKEKEVKFIIETGVLTDDEIIKCCDLYGVAGIDVFKTATGFGAASNSLKAVQLTRNHLADKVQVEAFYNGTNRSEAEELVSAGASLIAAENAVALLSAE